MSSLLLPSQITGRSGNAVSCEDFCVTLAYMANLPYGVKPVISPIPAR